MKVGIIRCLMTEDLCPGTMDFRVTAEGKGAFADTGPVEIVGFVTCGGCPGKRAIPRAKMLVERGAQAIVFASCITRGNPIGYPCPHYADMRDCVKKAIGLDVFHHRMDALTRLIARQPQIGSSPNRSIQ